VDVFGVHPTLGRNDDVGVQNFYQNLIPGVERTVGFEKVKREDVRGGHAGVFHRRHAESAFEKRPIFHQLFHEHRLRRVNRRHARTLKEGARERKREKSERFLILILILILILVVGLFGFFRFFRFRFLVLERE
jgi:nitrate reductase NapE component